jgi:NitT/TauT family transport system permease protein
MATEQVREESGGYVTTGALAAGTLSSAQRRIPGQPGPLARYEPMLIGAATVLAFLIVWQGAATLRLVPKLFLPGPLDIIAAYQLWGSTGNIWTDLWVSAREVLLGFLLAVAVGLPFGLFIGWHRRLAYALGPFIGFFNATPRIALIPIIIIWFGIGLTSKVTIIFISSVITVIINTQTGVLRAARRVRRLRVPHAVLAIRQASRPSSAS